MQDNELIESLMTCIETKKLSIVFEELASLCADHRLTLFKSGDLKEGLYLSDEQNILEIASEYLKEIESKQS